MRLLLLACSLLLSIISVCFAYIPLTDDALRTLVNRSNIQRLSVDNTQVNSFLSPLLIPRVSGTEGNKQVRAFLVSQLQNLGWKVELDQFNDTTPVGRVEFANIIATLGQGQKRLIVAAHYDSKPMEGGTFIGATDSSVPCAIILDMASTLTDILTKSPKLNETALQIVFFDGEEAFLQWDPPRDAIYGARHLASKWADSSQLQNINALVLLDLLGAAQPHIPSLQPSTAKLFANMSAVEIRMRQLGLLAAPGQSKYLVPDSMNNMAGSSIQDDHTPFLERGVPIMHLIPVPFPDTWHTFQDNAQNLDPIAIQNWAVLLRAFVAEYMDLDNAIAPLNKRDEL
ncbi:uncharacterized protein VTP21DRAFT_312 [Calcarisporiella thermophila]|uniref:uncharacterized protein n=1 Tax=Calcarisporiella thermophila TaxID=911321 RepID=UPI003744B10C